MCEEKLTIQHDCRGMWLKLIAFLHNNSIEVRNKNDAGKRVHGDGPVPASAGASTFTTANTRKKSSRSL